MRALSFQFGGGLILLASLAGAQSFQNPALIPTAFDPATIASADLNGDGIADLVYDTASINGTGTTVHVLLGKGDGTFNDVQDIGLPGPLGGRINIADVTGDGKLDLILGGGGSSTTSGVVATLPGNGDGTFGAPVISNFEPGGAESYIETGTKMGIADINGDGAPDLVIPDPENNSLYVLLGNKTGQFQFSGKIFNGSYPGAAYLTDLNGDGKPDLIAFGPLGGTASVYLGNGDGTFATAVNYSLGYVTSNMVLIDIDGDGHPDIVAEDYLNNGSQLTYQIEFLHGNANGTFAAPQAIVSSLSTTPGFLADVADYNGDGILDLVVANDIGIGFLPGLGNLTYGPVVSYLSGPTSTSVIGGTSSMAFGNFTSSGHRDVAMGAEGGIVELVNNGSGVFASAPFYDMGDPVGGATIADFNGDGNPDIAVTVPAEFPRVLLGKGDGTFQPETDENTSTSYGTNKPTLSIAAGDFTGSHVQDLAMPSTGGPVANESPEVLFGKGDGTFSVPIAETSGSSEVADVNGDGRADMVLADGANITVLLGQANGSFTTVTTPLRTPLYTQGVTAIGDVNGDGKPDLLIGAEIWLGNGDGTFTFKDTLNLSLGSTTVTYYATAAIADLNGDGNADLVLAGASGLQGVIILYGNGDGTFQAPTLYPTSHIYSSVVVADVNHDGKPDLILTDGAGIAVIRNLGNRSFAPEDHYVAGGYIGTLSVADLNHDGYPDIVVADSSVDSGPVPTTVAVLLNQPSVALLGGPTPNGSLVSTPNPSQDLLPFQVTLTLSSPAQGGTTPSGTVTFSVDGAFGATATLNAGVASFTDSNALNPGTHTITAAYNGDQNYRAAAYLGLQTVSPPVYPSSTALSITPASVLTSQTVHMQATVTATGTTPTGYVTFLDGGETLAASPLNTAGIAYFDTTLLSVGTHSIVADYDGYTTQNSFNPETILASASPPVAVTVGANATATTLSVSPASPTAGTVVTLTANVSSSAGTPFGGVTFLDGTTQLGTSSLASGQAAFSTASLATGQHSLTASYSANATWSGSTSQVQSVTLQAAAANLIPTFTSISAAANTSNDAVTVQAQVSSAGAAPQGAVTFLVDGTVLGTAITDQAGNAALVSTAAPISGEHIFTASYAGSSVFAPSVSPSLNRSWQTANSGFSLNLNTSAVTLTPSSAATILVTVTAPSGLSNTVGLACSAGLPQGYSCAFAPASLTGSGASILTISASRPLQTSSAARSLWNAKLGISLSLLLFLPLLKRKGTRRLMFVLALSALILMPSGCSVGAPSARANAVSILVVSASSGTGANAIVNSAQLTMRVRP